MAVRAALRSIPALDPRYGEEVILRVFRSVSAAWIAASGPEWRDNTGLSKGILAAKFYTNFENPRSSSERVLAIVSDAILTAVSEPVRWTAVAASAVSSSVATAPEPLNVIAFWDAVNDDASVLERANIQPSLLAAQYPLWSGQVPPWWLDTWSELKLSLLSISDDWRVWTTWFEARVNGGPVLNQEYEIARVMIADEIWKQGPRAVNAEIARLIGSREQDQAHPVNEFSRTGYRVHLGTPIISFEFGDHVSASLAFDALKRKIDRDEFHELEKASATNETLVVRFDPTVSRAAEVARKITEVIENAQILDPDRPNALLPQPSPAARFAYIKGRFDIAPTGIWGDQEAQAGIYHARARDLASRLAERLSRTDAVPDVAGSVAALVDVLGTSVADVQPDLLRLASRSIAAKARVYGHPAAQWEISADSVSAFFELADVLVDLQSFVKTDLEAHERAVRELDLTPEKAAESKIALDMVTEAILSAPEVISERAQTAFEAAAEVSETATDRDVKVAVEGDRTLLTANLALAVARELGRPIRRWQALTINGRPSRQWRSSRKSVSEHAV